MGRRRKGIPITLVESGIPNKQLRMTDTAYRALLIAQSMKRQGKKVTLAELSRLIGRGEITLYQQLRPVEKALGTPLFERKPRGGHILTRDGREPQRRGPKKKVRTVTIVESGVPNKTVEISDAGYKTLLTSQKLKREGRVTDSHAIASEANINEQYAYTQARQAEKDTGFKILERKTRIGDRNRIMLTVVESGQPNRPVTVTRAGYKMITTAYKLMQEGKLPTAENVARELGVNRSYIHRENKFLKDAGISPIIPGKQGTRPKFVQFTIVESGKPNRNVEMRKLAGEIILATARLKANNKPITRDSLGEAVGVHPIHAQAIKKEAEKALGGEIEFQMARKKERKGVSLLPREGERVIDKEKWMVEKILAGIPEKTVEGVRDLGAVSDATREQAYLERHERLEKIAGEKPRHYADLDRTPIDKWVREGKKEKADAFLELKQDLRRSDPQVVHKSPTDVDIGSLKALAEEYPELVMLMNNRVYVKRLIDKETMYTPIISIRKAEILAKGKPVGEIFEQKGRLLRVIEARGTKIAVPVMSEGKVNSDFVEEHRQLESIAKRDLLSFKEKPTPEEIMMRGELLPLSEIDKRILHSYADGLRTGTLSSKKIAEDAGLNYKTTFTHLSYLQKKLNVRLKISKSLARRAREEYLPFEPGATTPEEVLRRADKRDLSPLERRFAVAYAEALFEGRPTYERIVAISGINERTAMSTISKVRRQLKLEMKIKHAGFKNRKSKFGFDPKATDAEIKQRAEVAGLTPAQQKTFDAYFKAKENGEVTSVAVANITGTNGGLEITRLKSITKKLNVNMPLKPIREKSAKSELYYPLTEEGSKPAAKKPGRPDRVVGTPASNTEIRSRLLRAELTVQERRIANAYLKAIERDKLDIKTLAEESGTSTKYLRNYLESIGKKIGLTLIGKKKRQ